MERRKGFIALALLVILVGNTSCQNVQQSSGNLRRFNGPPRNKQSHQQRQARVSNPVGPRLLQQQRRFQNVPSQFQNQRFDFGGPPLRRFEAAQTRNEASSFIHPVQNLASVQLLESQAQLIPAILGSLTRHRGVLHAGGRVFNLEEAESEEETDSSPSNPVQNPKYSSVQGTSDSSANGATVLENFKRTDQANVSEQQSHESDSGGSAEASNVQPARGLKDTKRMFDLVQEDIEELEASSSEVLEKSLVAVQEPKESEGNLHTVRGDDDALEKHNTTDAEGTRSISMGHAEEEDPVLHTSTLEPAWKLFPLLLPPTPPGKPINSKFQAYAYAPDAQKRNSTSSAASLFAKLQPELRERYKDGLKQTQRLPSKPFRRRPVSRPTTEFSTPVKAGEVKDDGDSPTSQENSSQDIKTQANLELKLADTEPQESENTSKESDESGNESPATGKPVLPEVTAVKKTTAVSASNTELGNVKERSSKGSVDIKGLLRSAESQSLSEILQKKGLSLSDILKGGPGLLQELRSASASTSSEAQLSKKEPYEQLKASTSTSEPQTTTTTAATPTTTTTSITGSIATTSAPIIEPTLPKVVPMKLSQLLRARNQTLSDVIKGPSSNLEFTNANQLSSKDASARSVAATTETTTAAFKHTEDSPAEERLYLNAEAVTEVEGLAQATSNESTSAVPATSTTPTSGSTTAKSRRPYVPQAGFGEHNSRLDIDDEEDAAAASNSSTPTLQKVLQFGGNRPIAVSRLTPAPPRSQRPKYIYNWNTTSDTVASRMENSKDDERADSTTTTEQTTTMKVRFTDKDLREKEQASEVVPITMKNVIIASSVIGGFCLLVFLTILVVFRSKQKTRVRLRHSALFFGKARRAQAMGTDGSGTATPVTNTRSGYAKLAYRNSLWGTLRRTLRNVDS